MHIINDYKNEFKLDYYCDLLSNILDIIEKIVQRNYIDDNDYQTFCKLQAELASFVLEHDDLEYEDSIIYESFIQAKLAITTHKIFTTIFETRKIKNIPTKMMYEDTKIMLESCYSYLNIALDNLEILKLPSYEYSYE